MTSNREIAVIVRDSEIRDLVCLNLRFESFVTHNYEDINSFLRSGNKPGLIILDITGERDPRNLISKIHKVHGDKVQVLCLSDRGTPSIHNVKELLIESQGGRKRFDAVQLISLVKEVFDSIHDEPTKHPLTGLPSGIAVEKHINSLIAGGLDFALISGDLDNMKAFNQRFGYARGDELLRRTVKLIENVLNKEYKNGFNYIGHRGEDDFVVITSPDASVGVGEKIVDGFDAMAVEFFDQSDIERGYFLVSDKRGNELRFPITTISLVIINAEGRRFSHPAELYDAADEIMYEVKSRGVNQSYCAAEKRR